MHAGAAPAYLPHEGGWRLTATRSPLTGASPLLLRAGRHSCALQVRDTRSWCVTVPHGFVVRVVPPPPGITRTPGPSGMAGFRDGKVMSN